MQRRALLWAAGLTLAIGCKENASEANDGQSDACSEEGATRCDGKILQICDGSRFATSKTCTDQCLEVQAGVHECVAGTGCVSSTNCASGEVCISQNCVQKCDPAAAGACPSDEFCLAVENSETDGVCFPLSDTGELCAADAWCMNDGAVCYLAWQVNGMKFGVCGANCAASEMNKGQGSCPEGTACLPFAGYYEAQNPQTTCTAGDDSPCDVANSYACVKLTSGTMCSRPVAICGVQSRIVSGPVEEVTDAMLCALDGFNVAGVTPFCGINGAAGEPADAFCYEALPDTDDVGVCFALCDGPNGTTLDCGQGYDCAAPTDPLFYSRIVELDDQGEAIDCNSTSCSTSYTCSSSLLACVIACSEESSTCPEGSECVEFSSGTHCASPLRMCTAQ